VCDTHAHAHTTLHPTGSSSDLGFEKLAPPRLNMYSLLMLRACVCVCACARVCVLRASEIAAIIFSKQLYHVNYNCILYADAVFISPSANFHPAPLPPRDASNPEILTSSTIHPQLLIASRNVARGRGIRAANPPIERALGVQIARASSERLVAGFKDFFIY